MVNVSFNIGCIRTRPFTSTQINKIEEGINIFNEVVNSPSFKKRILDFNWRTQNGTTYQRFHLCNGLSNEQVWTCFENGTVQNVDSKAKTPIPNAITIIPFINRSEMTFNFNPTTPSIWFDVNCIDQAWYTPVHVACCLIHEYCVNVGFSAHWNGQRVNYWRQTVPYAFAEICYNVACEMSTSKHTDWKGWCANIDINNFDYCPCSHTCWTNGIENNIVAPCVQLDEIITLLNTEVQWLGERTKPSNDEVNRMTTLTNTVNTLREMKSKLFVTSLDGCERVGVTVAEIETVAVR